MSEKQLGVLVNGAGWVSGEHVRAFKNNPNSRVVAISDIRREAAERRARDSGVPDARIFTDLGEALRCDGVDIVSVCTPQHVHAENVIQAAEAGKHVVIEKPIANSLREMEAMRDAVRRSEVRSVVSFVLRWNPLFQLLKNLIADDAFGKVYYVDVDYQSNIASWWSGFEEGRKKATGISALLLAGCHALDAARWFVSPEKEKAAQVTEVFAYSGGWRKGSSREYNYYTRTWAENMPSLEYDGLEVCLLKFSDGAVGKVSVNSDCIMPYTFPFEIFGSKGTVKGNRIWSHKLAGQTDWVEIPSILPDSAEVSHHPFQGEMDHFVDCVLNDRESHCNLEDAIRTHEIVFAALQCYETGCPVKLPLIAP